MTDPALSLQHARDNMGDWLSEFEEICESHSILLAALTKIATAPEGAYSRDKEQYLKNVLEWCQETASNALAQVNVGDVGAEGLKCPECGGPQDDRVLAGMKCGRCAY